MDMEFENEELLVVDGIVETVMFENKDNGYTVCLLETEDELITAVGIMPCTQEGEIIRAQGKWETHPSYGKQFRVVYYEKQLPATGAAMIKYLSSGIIKGIRKKTAEKIVGMFGDETLDVIENAPHLLCDIPGIGFSRADAIAKRMEYSTESPYRIEAGIHYIMTHNLNSNGPVIVAGLCGNYRNIMILNVVSHRQHIECVREEHIVRSRICKASITTASDTGCSCKQKEKGSNRLAIDSP